MMNTPSASQNAYSSLPEQPFQMITRVLSNVVDMQQNMITNFSNISSQVESLRVEMRSSISELRSDILRGEDKHMANVMETHDKEVDRMMRLLENLSVKSYGDAATPAPQKQTTVDPLITAQIQQLQSAQQQMASLLVRNAGIFPNMVQYPMPYASNTLAAPIVTPSPAAAPMAAPKSAAVTPVTSVAPVAFSIAKPAVPVVPNPTVPVVSSPAVPVAPNSAQLKFGPATSVAEKIQPPAVSNHDEEEDGGEHPEAYEPEADFAPVIPLPELVKVVTGEENEKILFETRCKVYRFTDKEWKERGTGDLKVLENPETGRRRIVMRRDQVFKVCVNHGFDSSMKIEKMAKNAKAVSWVCMDASDGEPTLTQLSARFASEELATDFKKTFEKCVDNAKSKSPMKTEAKFEAKSTSSGSSSEIEIPKNQGIKKEPKAESKETAGFDWKKPEGSWDCQGCYVTNPAGESKCKCCGTGKDGSPPETTTQVIAKPISAATAPSSSIWSFGVKQAMPSIGTLSLSSKEVAASTTTSASNTSVTESNKSSFGSPFAPKENGTPTTVVGADVSAKSPFSFAEPRDEKSFSFGRKPEAAKPVTPGVEFTFNRPVVPATTATATPTGNKYSFADAAKLAANDDAKKPITFSFGQKPSLAQSPLASATASNAPTTTPTFTFKPAAAGQKSLFGGSASTASPTSSLFGGGTASSATASPNPMAATDSKPAEQKSVFGSMFGNSSGSNTFGFSTPKTNIFEGQSAQNAKDALSALKKAQPFGSKQFTNEDEESKGADEEYEPDVDFKPVIPLPDLVELKTGEEGEEVIFKERCKLYRYNRETKETAERGTGDMKILKNPETGRFRCVMRREQVHKLCANFRLTNTLSISPKTNAPNVAVFNCKDFSDRPEGDDETFFVRFKTPEQCQTFINTFRSGVAAAT